MHNDIVPNGGIAPQYDQLSRIPAEMRARPQWALAGAGKAPLSIDANGKLYNISIHKPEEWLTFERAAQLVEQYRTLTTTHTDNAGNTFTHIGLNPGFILTAADLLTCVDLDVVNEITQKAKGQPVDPSKWTSPEELERFAAILKAFDSYTEASRSGQGAHTWCYGNVGKGWRRDGIEVYSQDRFIICTGNVWWDRPLADRQELLANMVRQMEPAHDAVRPLPDQPQKEDDQALIARAMRAANAEKFILLARGEWQGRYGSQSEADMALLGIMAFYSPNNEQCRRIFRMTELGKRRKATKDNRYLDRTLDVIRFRQAGEAEGTEQMRAFFDQIGTDVSTSVTNLPAVQAQQAGQVWTPATDNSARFQLLCDDDLDQLPPLRWLVKGIIPDAGIGAIFGDSGTFKSFLTLDLLAHISNGKKWFGKKVKAAPAVYIPFEGQGGVPNRIKAWRLAEAMRLEPDSLNIAVPPANVRSFVAVIVEPMNLREAADREKLVTTLIEDGWAGGVLCIDTLAHASNGIDENSSQMGEMIGIFRDLQHRLGGVILLIHHSGKDQTRGMRGWSGLHAAMDFVVECQRVEDKRQAKFVLSKVKDGSDGLSFKFDTFSLVVGYDEDGEQITSLTVHPDLDESGTAEVGANTKQTKKGINAIDAETSAMDDGFVEGWIRNQVSSGNYPSKNSLKGQLPDMKETYPITQDRVGAAVERLLSQGKVVVESTSKSPNGNVWLRPSDYTPHVAPAVGTP